MSAKAIISLIFISAIPAISLSVSGQNRIPELSGNFNPITTALPFLAWHAGPSVNGAITSVPDGTSGPGIFGNPGLPALDTFKFGVIADYSLWPHPAFVKPGVFLVDFGAFYRLNDRHTLGINLRAYDDGDMDMIDFLQHTTYTIHPLNLAAGISYTYNPDNLTGIGAGVRFIHSGGLYENHAGGHEHRNTQAMAVDLGFARQFPGGRHRVDHFLGISINNAGTKIWNQDKTDKHFIPTTLTTGYGLRANFSRRHSLSLSYELSKLLVPTPPALNYDSLDSNFNPTIKAGYDPDVGVFRGMIQSFYDAPGGFREELHEINHSIAMVYHFRFISAGAGYHFEHPTKGNAKMWSFGVSGNIRFGHTGKNRVQINLAYLRPAVSMHNPFGRMMRFGVSYNLGN